jgi:hypothetical protein
LDLELAGTVQLVDVDLGLGAGVDGDFDAPLAAILDQRLEALRGVDQDMSGLEWRADPDRHGALFSALGRGPARRGDRREREHSNADQRQYDVRSRHGSLLLPLQLGYFFSSTTSFA